MEGMALEYFYVYLMGSMSGTLYIGITNDLRRRVAEHKSGLNNGFTKRYECKRLLYYERFLEPTEAIKREKEIKGWLRNKKEALIHRRNPMWFDLASKWWLPIAKRYEHE